MGFKAIMPLPAAFSGPRRPLSPNYGHMLPELRQATPFELLDPRRPRGLMLLPNPGARINDHARAEVPRPPRREFEQHVPVLPRILERGHVFGWGLLLESLVEQCRAGGAPATKYALTLHTPNPDSSGTNRGRTTADEHCQDLLVERLCRPVADAERLSHSRDRSGCVIPVATIASWLAGPRNPTQRTGAIGCVCSEDQVAPPPR